MKALHIKMYCAYAAQFLLSLQFVTAQTSYNGNSVPINGTSNTVLGPGLKLITFGQHNTAVGFNAMLKTAEGSKNTAVGYNALLKSTSGEKNTAVGSESLDSNINGFDNTAVGVWALHYNTQGYYNTANGSSALYSNTIGWSNTAVGENTLGANTSGNANTTIGGLSLNNNSIGSYNMAGGYQSLSNNNSGNFNTSLGARSGTSNRGNSNLFLGYAAGSKEVSANNKLYIASDSNKTLIYGDFLTGQVLLGVPEPSTYSFKGNRKLNVVGGIITDSIRVALIGAWSDYVFSPSYHMRTLPELVRYINLNKHLPGLPSAEAVKKDGIDLAVMNSKLLAKLEELYLYVIVQQKEIANIKMELEKLKRNRH
jgi:hypothetical protein